MENGKLDEMLERYWNAVLKNLLIEKLYYELPKGLRVDPEVAKEVRERYEEWVRRGTYRVDENFEKVYDWQGNEVEQDFIVPPKTLDIIPPSYVDFFMDIAKK